MCLCRQPPRRQSGRGGGGRAGGQKMKYRIILYRKVLDDILCYGMYVYIYIYIYMYIYTYCLILVLLYPNSILLTTLRFCRGDTGHTVVWSRMPHHVVVVSRDALFHAAWSRT